MSRASTAPGDIADRLFKRQEDSVGLGGTVQYQCIYLPVHHNIKSNNEIETRDLVQLKLVLSPHCSLFILVHFG